MRHPFARRRRPAGKVRTVGVGDRGALLRPLDPPLPPRLSSQQARDAVHKAISEMSQTGALDAGTGDVLDPWLESLRTQWLAHHAMVCTDREATARHAAGRYEGAAAAARARAGARAAERDTTRRLVAAHEQRMLAPTDGSPSDRPERRRRPRPALDGLEGLTPGRGWRILSILLLLVAAAGDFASFYLALASLGGEAYILLTLTVAFTAAAVGVMHVAGRTARNLQEGEGGLGRAVLAVCLVSWAVLGAVAFVVRTRTAEPVETTADAIFGADAGAPAVAGQDPLLAALLLGALYVASGVLAWLLGFSEHHPRMRRYLALRRTLGKQEERAATAEQAAIEAERLAAEARAELDRTAARTAAARAGVDAEIDELKELVRIHLAGYVGEPSSTNALVSGRSAAASGAPPAARPAPDDVDAGGAGRPDLVAQLGLPPVPPAGLRSGLGRMRPFYGSGALDGSLNGSPNGHGRH